MQVDLRGFGGSSGCLDYMGEGEQADVKAAIDWASKQPWSTGKVGMYGKSYDATTGLVGNNLDQDALKAVVAQEPVWDMYRLTRSNKVPKLGGVLAPNTYNQVAQLPPLPDDQKRYKKNNQYELKHPECAAYNTDNNLKADPDDPYWRQRDLAKQAKGSDTPLFFTQGFIESNTTPEAMQEYLAGHKGTERAWLGQWDHVRGNSRTEDGRLEMGRPNWFKEVMSFYDQQLKGTDPTTDHPAFAIQDSTGTWRAQDTWPESDRSADVPLRDGSYVDKGEPGDSASHLTWSNPSSATSASPELPGSGWPPRAAATSWSSCTTPHRTAQPSCSTSRSPWPTAPAAWPWTSSRPTGGSSPGTPWPSRSAPSRTARGSTPRPATASR